ncbi:Plant calmodulin-binding domain [Musa troglodytarum]|uniref:Plant calmodulin-binding domain n=1 Tax=Musa troglodytarum TaxID=320322 RepID=A0A9E7FYL5_9LILI|nr:Plant calmodulin-binding domain [Musa troglodytarum]
MTEEATEKVIVSITPEIFKPKSSVGRLSTGKTKTRTSPCFRESGEKPVPHYLRTSTGSCHDFCKYGIKQDLQVKKRRPARQTFLANKEMPDDENNQVNAVTWQDRRKKASHKIVVSQGKEQCTKKSEVIKQNDVPPEKIIQLCDSLTNLAEGSAEKYSNMKLGFPSTDQMIDSFLGHSPANQSDNSTEESTSIKLMTLSSISTINEFDEHKPTRSSEVLSEKIVSIKLDQTATQNGDDSTELAPTEGGSSAEPVMVKHMVTSSTQHIRDSALHTTVMEDTEFAEHVTSGRPDTSPDKSTELPRSSNLPSNMKPKKHKDVSSASNGLANGAAGCTGEDSTMKRKATLSTVPAMGLPLYQEEELSNQGKQVIGSGVGAEARRDVNRLKRGNKIIGISHRPKVIRQGKIDLSGVPNGKTAPNVWETASSVKPEAEQRIISATPRAVKEKALSAGKKVDASPECATSMRIKNLSFKTISRLASSGGLARRNNERIIKFSSQSDIKEKVLEPSLSSPSMKPPTSRVSTTKPRMYRNMGTASQVKNQTRAGKLGMKKETLNVREATPEKINLKTMKQDLRKHKSHPSDGKDHDSESKLGEILRKAVTQRFPTVISKSEIQRKHRRTASVHLEDKISAAHKLKFNRGKVVSLQHENNGPRILRFRRARTANDIQNAKGDAHTKGYKSKTGPSGADSNSPMSKAPAVVLRHQDVQEKKDNQGLLNQVIEETASKLVETRKSKVKALVGAFETVISLQDSKVASHAVP